MPCMYLNKSGNCDPVMMNTCPFSIGVQGVCDKNKKLAELAKKGYEAYGKSVDYKNYQSLPMLKWDSLPENIKVAWMAAIEATREEKIDESL